MNWLEILAIVVGGVFLIFCVQERIADAVKKKKRARRRAAQRQTRQTPRPEVSSASVPSMNNGMPAARAHGVPMRRNPVPPRRGQTPMAPGPRGVRPDQFPCCPLDRERNVAGKPQKIFWNSAENCYRCSHGHRFKSNGHIL